MAALNFAILLIFGIVALSTAQSDDNATVEGTTTRTTSTRTTTILHSEELSAGNISLKVRGRGGRFTAYALSLADPNRVVFSMDALREVDAKGRAVGTSSAGGVAKHTIPSFAMQDFALSAPQRTTVGAARGEKIVFGAPVGRIGRAKLETLLVTKAGPLGPTGSMWYTEVGDVKWSVSLGRWNWCGCEQGGVEQTGSFIDLDIFLDGSLEKPVKVDVGSNSWDLGGGVIAELTNKIQVDGKVVEMPQDFPRAELRGDEVVFVVRFPRFANYAVYESLLRMSSSESLANATHEHHVPAFVSHGFGPALGRGAWLLVAASLLLGVVLPSGRA